MREEQSKVPRIKKGQPNSTESDGLFLIRQGQAVSQAADPTLTCRPVSQTGRRLSLAFATLSAAVLISQVSTAQDLTPG